MGRLTQLLEPPTTFPREVTAAHDDTYYALLAAQEFRDAVFVTDADARIEWANAAFSELTGHQIADVIGCQPRAFLYGPDTDPEALRRIRRAIDDRKAVQVEVLCYAPSGRSYWVEVDIRPVFDESGRHRHFIAVHRDITERRRSKDVEEAARQTELRTRRERRLLTEMSEWLYACRSLEELYDIIRLAMPRLLPNGPGLLYVYRNSQDRLEVAARWGDAAAETMMNPVDCWAMRRGRLHSYGGQLINVPCTHMVRDDVVSSCVPLLAHGATLGMLHLAHDDLLLVGRNTDEAQLREIDERRQLALLCAEQFGLAIANMRLRGELETQSSRDVLTGLHNRRWFQSSARTALEDSLTTGGSFSLVSLDVDRFKQLNDNFGHSTGDVVLREIANVLRESCDDGCTPCRLGGEEFVIIMPRHDATAALALAESVIDRVRGRAMSTAAITIPQVTISAGVAIAPSDGNTVDGLLEAADRALYAAKRAGRDRVVRADGIEVLPRPDEEHRQPACAGVEFISDNGGGRGCG